MATSRWESVSPSQRAAVRAFDSARRAATALRRAGQDLAAEQLMARVAAAINRELGTLTGVPASADAPDARGAGDVPAAGVSAGARARNSWRRGGRS